VRQFLAKNLTLLTLLSLVTAFVLIAVGVFWALKAGYEGYQNANTDQELIAKNNQAVDMLNRGDYQDAYPSLAALSQQVKPGSPLYDKVQHNLGSCWFEAGQAAQGRGDLTEARNDYEKALPLLPERQMEINQDLEAVQMGAGGTPAPAPATSSPAPTPADPGAGAQPGTPTSPGSNVGTTPTPAAPVGNGGSAPSTTAPGVAGGSTPAGGTTPPSSPLSPPPGSAAPTRTEENIQSRNEYNAAQRAQRNGDPAGAREHYEKSVNLDPGAGWARDAQHQLDTLSP
jgi:tetratricopeptide (TPR) repeat protein